MRFRASRCLAAGLMAVIAMALDVRPASADDATRPATAPSAEVAGLIADLGSDSYTVRQNAQEKLSAMEEAVEPQLTAALGNPMSEEARTRLKAVIDRIEQGKPLAPSVITMHYTNALAVDVLRDFQTQARADMGADTLLTSLGATRISVNLDHADFWQALRAVTDATGARLGAGMKFVGTGPPVTWINSAGKRVGLAFVGPVSCQQMLQFYYGNPAQDINRFQLRLNVGIEPKLHVLTVDTDNWVKECVDEKGHSLIALGGPAQPVGPMGLPRQAFTTLMANLNVVPEIGQKIATLKGEIHCKAPLQSESIELDDPAKVAGITRVCNGATIKLTELTMFGGNIWQLGIVVTGNLGDDPDQLASLLRTEFQITDNQGRVYLGAGGETDYNADQLTMALRFTQGGMPGARRGMAAPVFKKFVWEVPTEIGDMTIPFEFHNLDLPAVN